MRKLLRFSAIWCPECLVSQDIWEKVISDFPSLVHESVDIDEREDLSLRYSIKKVPVYMFVEEDGSEIARLTGYQERDDLEKFIRSNS